MTARFRLCIVMISQKSPFTESDINEKTSIIYYVIYEENYCIWHSKLLP
ncbi:Uncharacterised protein [Bacteroides xylanisolvens]|nr:Uncharacterised protein [Bacteroides xylanisolvens]